MADNISHQTAEEIILPLPTADELDDLRKKYKLSKTPKLSDGANWSNSKVGSFSVKQEQKDVIVTWKVIDQPERSASFENLCGDPKFEFQRLELGWMIANMLRVEAIRVLHSIPDPNEAMKQSDFYNREEDYWRSWALSGNHIQMQREKNK